MGTPALSIYNRLPVKRQLFVDAHIANPGSATKAAIKAGYVANSAHVTASRLLKSDKVLAAIAERRKRASNRAVMDAAKVLQELTPLAASDVRHLVDENGYLRGNLNDLPEHVTKAISSVEQETAQDGTVKMKVKLWDKNKALVSAGRHVGVRAFVDRIEVSGGLSDRLSRLHDESIDVTPVSDASPELEPGTPT